MTDAAAKVTTVETISQFVHEVSELRDWPADLRPTFWFRGQANAAWKLQPTVLRDWFTRAVQNRCINPDSTFDVGLATAEATINQEFRRSAAHLIKPEATLVDIYFLAQHHGLATRLLDWSTNAMAALFFAVADQGKGDSDGMVFVMCPNSRIHHGERIENKKRGAPSDPVDIRHELVQNVIGKLFDDTHDDSLDTRFVIPVLPDSRAGRMLQQGSCFTLHGPECQPISPASYSAYHIPKECKERIQSDLRVAGITWATLFPDLDNVCREIRTHYCLYP